MGNVIFVVIFVIFCAFLLGAGLISKRWVKESSDFVLAGREISTPINVVGVIAIGFAGTTVTLAPGFTIQYGLLGGLGWGVIYSVCGLLIFGLLYSNFVRRSGAQTLPEFLEMRYDGHTRSVVAITSVIGMCGIMANNVVSSVDNIAAFTGWNRLAITAIIFAVIIVFTFVSGLWATTITDLFQVLIGVIVVPATFFILAGRFGWLDAISANWGAGDFMSQGFVGALPGMKLTYPSVFNFIICFAVALVWGNNYYWMKVANCRSEKVARRSFVAAAIILIVVFMVPLCFIGGYMGAFYPEQLTLNGGTVAPTGTYGYVAKTFVSLFGSLVVISAVAASISTASTSALGASAVANRDIYQRLINPKADAKKSLKMSKIIMLLIGVVTFVLCQFPGGPTYLFAFANCWLVPPAILLGLGAIWPRFNGRGALWGAVCGMATMAVFTLLDLTKVFSINSYVYLATLGLVVTLVVAVIASLFGQPKYYGRPGWERVPTASNRKEVKLGELEKQILEMLRIGHCYMSDLTDALGVDSKTSGAAVENLDQGGYLVRAGMSGSKFYTFTITEKGLAALPALSGKEAEMAEEFLNPLYVQLLKVVKENPEQQAEFVQKNGIKSMRMSAICSHLNSYVYLATLGLVVTLVVAVIASLFGQPKYYGRPGWERVPTASNRKEVKLGELEKQILEMLRIGHCYMSDLTDALGVDSKTSGAAVENLDQGGYLVRAGMSGSKFYTFTITEKGLAALPALSGKEAEMAEEFLNPLYVQLLKVVKENPEQQAEFVQKNGIKSMRMSAICSHLTRRGYVVEGGLFKRKLRITEKGAAALQKYA